MENIKDNQYHIRHLFQPNSEDSNLFEKLYFHAFDPNLFRSRWKELEKIDLSLYDDASVRNLIRQTITFQNSITNQEYYFIPTWLYSYKKNDKFYRIRKIKGDQNTIPVEEITKWSDLWNRPATDIHNYGRLNYPEESLLYTAAGDPTIAIREMKLKENEKFALITYEALEDINVTMVGCHKEISGISIEENKKREILIEFFSQIFTREVTENNNHLYKITSNLIKECYTIEDGSQDGWIYPSIANKVGYNVCFKPKQANKKLKVVGVEICRLNDKYNFIVDYVLDKLEENLNFSYHHIGSDIQRKRYPHISMCE